MNSPRRHQADAAMPVFVVVPGKELPAEAPGVLNGTKTVWEARVIFQRLKL